MADSDKRMDVVKTHFDILNNYINFDSQGMLLAKSCGNIEMLENTNYKEEAYD